MKRPDDATVIRERKESRRYKSKSPVNRHCSTVTDLLKNRRLERCALDLVHQCSSEIHLVLVVLQILPQSRILASQVVPHGRYQVRANRPSNERERCFFKNTL